MLIDKVFCLALTLDLIIGYSLCFNAGIILGTIYFIQLYMCMCIEFYFINILTKGLFYKGLLEFYG